MTEQTLPPEPGLVGDPDLGVHLDGDVPLPLDEPDEPTEVNDEEDEEDDDD